jgi:uridine monophosphate synthetase
MKDLILKLHSIGAIKFGNFEIKKDFFVPFQLDFSAVISHPKIAKEICAALFEKGQHLSFDLLCGVPTVGACFANFIAWDKELPLVLKKPKVKGSVLNIEGSFKSGQKCLVIQDLFLTGERTLDLIEALEAEGIKVIDTLAFVDLEMGAKKKMKKRGYVPHAVIGIREILQILNSSGKLAGNMYKLAIDLFENG